MNRLKRFGSHRFIGDRRTMIVYDCDEPAQFIEIESLVDECGLLHSNSIQTFGPDELIEALNRSFSPIR